MCGRYRFSQAERFAELNEIRLGGIFPARFNIAPTQRAAIVFDESPGVVAEAQWGLVPSWAKDRKIASSLINGRVETVETKPAFRAAYKRRRCLVPADGFYEWKQTGDAVKVPHHIGMTNGEPFAFAGLWEVWSDPAAAEAEPLRTYTILTGAPNELVASLHNRMPVIIPRSQYAAWLSPATTPEERRAMLVPFPAEAMTAYAISTRVNSPRIDDVQIIEPLC